ncbi:MAG: hypothetical protein ACE37F_17040 [Nannocystaceae bacterium]|nr:hypothetical protein [bacterium]
MQPAATRQLRRAVGQDDFYSIVANLDRNNAAGWREMVAVQRDFAAGESGYDTETRTYSESMRLTLHWSLVLTLESQLRGPAQSSDGGLFGHFVRLHPTAFKANGACTLDPRGMASVMFNTRGSMFNVRNIAWIAQGLASRYEVAIQAADRVRADRRRAGKPVTTNGYESRRPSPGIERLMRRQNYGRSTHNAMGH